MQPNSDRHIAGSDGSKTYKLRLSPIANSSYHYDISNESELKMESGQKKVDNVNRSNTGVYYEMTKDSAGNFVFHIRYDKVHLYTNSSGTETEMDAANAATTHDPLEKMLGALTSARIVAVITPLGEVKTVTGYKEMGDKIMEGFNNSDLNVRKMARSRLEQVIGNGIVKKNMDQLFKIFPDSAVHIGDQWKSSGKQQSDLNLNVNNSFTLKGIDDGVALIRSEGDMTSDSAAISIMGYEVTANLKGHQRGDYEIDTKTGMLVNASITAHVEGAMQVMGRDIPITVDMKVKMNGRKLP